MDDAAVSEITRPNPLAAGLTPTPACILVIFGGAGDLSRRKLLPALYNLMLDGQLSSRFAIVSFSKEEMDDDSYRSFARTAVEQYSRQPVTDVPSDFGNVDVFTVGYRYYPFINSRAGFAWHIEFSTLNSVKTAESGADQRSNSFFTGFDFAF